MNRPYVVIPCECEQCILANTQAVRIAGRLVNRQVQPGEVLHGTDATRYLDAQRRGTERVGEIGERLRAELLGGRE